MIATLLACLLVAGTLQEPAQSVWALSVNGVANEDVVLVLDDADEIWLPIRALEDAGLRGFVGERRELFGQAHVRLASLASVLTAVRNDQDLSLALTALPELFAGASLDAVARGAPDIEYSRPFSMFTTYDALWSSTSGTSAVAEVGLSLGGHSLVSTVSRLATGEILRGQTTLTFDRPHQRVRIEGGDVLVGGIGLLASSGLVAGVRISRDAALDPYYVPYSTPSIGGSVHAPATAELFINGPLSRQFELGPGPFTLANLPISAGRGTLRVVTRDAFGRIQQFSSRYYLTTSTLRRGEHDFSYSAGVRRVDTTQGTTYGRPIGSLLHRVGVTNAFSMGLFAEGDQEVQQGGPIFNVRLGTFGELEFNNATSWFDGRLGGAATGSYEFSSKAFSVGLSGQWFSESYATLDERPEDREQPYMGSATISFPLGRLASISLQAAREEQITLEVPLIRLPHGQLPTIVDRTHQRRASINGTMRIHARLNLHSRVSYIREEEPIRHSWSGFIGLGFIAGGRTTGSVTTSRDESDGAITTVTNVNQPLPRTNGVGYRVDADAGVSRRVSAVAELQHPWGRLAVGHDYLQGQPSATTVQAQGSVVYVGRTLALTRPVTSSFALIRVPVPHVRIYFNNDEVGRTNGRGRLLLQNLQAYYGNGVSFEHADVPLTYGLEEVRKLIAPPYRGAALVTFPVSRLHTYTGRVVLTEAAGEVVPLYGTLTLTGVTLTEASPIGSDGDVYFEKLEPGTYAAEVSFGDVVCRFQATVPASTELVFEMGTWRCPVTTSGDTVQ